MLSIDSQLLIILKNFFIKIIHFWIIFHILFFAIVSSLTSSRFICETGKIEMLRRRSKDDSNTQKTVGKSINVIVQCSMKHWNWKKIGTNALTYPCHERANLNIKLDKRRKLDQFPTLINIWVLLWAPNKHFRLCENEESSHNFRQISTRPFLPSENRQMERKIIRPNI